MKTFLILAERAVRETNQSICIMGFLVIEVSPGTKQGPCLLFLCVTYFGNMEIYVHPQIFTKLLLCVSHCSNDWRQSSEKIYQKILNKYTYIEKDNGQRGGGVNEGLELRSCMCLHQKFHQKNNFYTISLVKFVLSILKIKRDMCP